MKLTRAGEYAVRCILYLALQPLGATVNRREMAKTMDIPYQFLGKVAPDLAKAGLIDIVQGAKGGYRLILPPREITLLDVVEAIQGELFFNDCVIRPESCYRSSNCAVHKVWEETKNKLRETLRAANFEELARQEVCLAPHEPQECGEPVENESDQS